MKNQKYKWRGILDGKAISGEANGFDKNQISFQLRKQGIKPIKINKKLFIKKPHNKVTYRDITRITKELFTLMSTGISIMDSLKITKQNQSTKYSRVLINDLIEKINNGDSLFSTLENFPNHFDTNYRQLVKIAEKSGQLVCILGKIVKKREQHESLSKKIRKAFLYPSITLTVIISVTGILLIYVTPQFKQLFSNFNSEMPWMTQFVFSLSENLSNYFLNAAYYITATTLTFYYIWNHTEKAKILLEKIIINLPILGKILKKYMISTYSYSLSTCLSAGIPLLDSLKSMENLFEYRIFKEVINSIYINISKGKTLHASMKETCLFPEKAIQLIAIGESSGSLEKTLEQMSLNYEEETNSSIDTMTTLIEPITILLLSGIVGILVMSMYLPVFQIGGIM